MLTERNCDQSKAFKKATSTSPQRSSRHPRPSKFISSSWDIRRSPWSPFSVIPAIYQNAKPLKDLSIPTKSTLSATSVTAICYSSGVSDRNSCETTGEEVVMMICLYTIDKSGKIQILMAARLLFTWLALQYSPHRLTSIWDTKTPFQSQPRRHVLKAIFYASLEKSTCIFSETRRVFHLLQYHLFEITKSVFGFLKYAGARRLPPSRKILLDEEGYQITHVGKGAFAVISRVLYRPTGEVRVMKRITFDESGLAQYLAKNEVDALKAMARNVWVPQLFNAFSEGGQFVVTMPFYRRGDLACLMQHKRHLGRETAQFYSAQLVLAIQCLHKVGIIHRDIKPDNIFLDEEGHLVLADFGLAENIATYDGGEAEMVKYPLWVAARETNDDNFPFLWIDEHNPLGMRGVAGTFWYTAPEVFRKERYSFGVDYWSVGVIYHELLTGHVRIPFNHFKPYPENKRPDLDFRRKPGQLKDIVLWEEKALSELLAPYPTGRPKTLTDIKNNRIFRDVDWISMSQKKIHPPSLPPPLLEN